MENNVQKRQTLSVLQQIEELKNWHKQHQSKLKSHCDDKEEYNLQNTKNQMTRKPELEKRVITQQNFDEIPIKSTIPNFEALVKNSSLSSDDPINQSEQNEKKPAFRFLKKGEGIARFRMGPQKLPRYKGRSNRVLNLSGSKSESEKTQFSAQNPATAQSYSNKDEIPKLNPPDAKLDLKSLKSIFDNGKAEEIIEKIINSKQLEYFQPDSSIDSSTASFMEQVISFGRKHLKEKEELRVFEAIEQHILDSSFCSTSSYVTRLMENAIISTPVKNSPYSNDTAEILGKSNQYPVHLPEIEVNLPSVGEASKQTCQEAGLMWTNPGSMKDSGHDSQGAKEDKELEESLHVRFAKNVDYKSFEEYSRSINNSNQKDQNTNEEFNESEEWKEEMGEDSVCCSQCSTSYSSSDEDDRAISPPGQLPPVLQNHLKNQVKLQRDTQVQRSPVERLQVADLETKTFKEKESKVPLSDGGPILGEKIKELEQEIDTFKEENKKLKSIRETLEKERKQLQQEKKKFLKELEEEKKKNEVQLEEEKQKLAKEKFIFEKYSKSLTKTPSKEERKEIQALREQLSEMKEELNKKESRWGAAQARVRNQVKLLEEDNKKLREEVEVLRKQAKYLEILTQKKKGKPANNTKLIHAINEYISNNPIEEQDVTKSSSTGSYFSSKENPVKTVIVEVDPSNTSNVRVIRESEKGSTARRSCDEIEQKYQKMIEGKTTNDSQKESKQGENHSKTEDLGKNETVSSLSVQKVQQSKGTTNHNLGKDNSPTETVGENGTIERIFDDGRKEVVFKNGNVKKIDPITGNEKTIYFNGDVKEIKSDRTVKYYFSESRIWHTTLPDGLEILDFPNGQVEKRHTNGLVEVIYPNNCKKFTYPDGSEETFYADGTKLRVEPDKKKILSLPNGQREIQTEESVRREYPDGTVKIVYPDGVSETIYANGRVRLKDKHGHLIMDSATSGNML